MRYRLGPTKKSSASAHTQLLQREEGQSAFEIAIMLPLLLLLVFGIVDYGYYFIVAAGLTSSARNATEYAIQGFSSPSSGYSSASMPTPPLAGSISTTGSVAALALADLTSFANSTTQTTVQVCSSTVNTKGTLACQTWGASSKSWTPDVDPEPTKFQLYRVDILYQISPPLPITFLGYNLVPTYQFHRMAEMRGMN
ncbi:MAG TPA: TadE/TadG family type IV pilus assembly protein [Edaphobacter sp.]|nr:TadE/TadG family type IV pilus assembly protein [Edaphobacter sp.]